MNGTLAKLLTYLSFTFADGRGLVVVSAGIKVQYAMFLDTLAVCYSDVHQLTLPSTTQNIIHRETNTNYGLGFLNNRTMYVLATTVQVKPFIFLHLFQYTLYNLWPSSMGF